MVVVFEDGFVTTFEADDLPVLNEIMGKEVKKTDRAGLHPTPDQIELFGYYLPNYPLSDLVQLFTAICQIDENGHYFLSNMNETAYLASLIDHIPLRLNVKYTFATSPIAEKQPFACTCFVKFVRSYEVALVINILVKNSVISYLNLW